MPVSNFAQAAKFSAMCGTSVPDWLAAMFEGTEDDPETRRLIAAVVAAEQVRLLQANGVDEFHFYTLNRADLTYADRPRPRRPAGRREGLIPSSVTHDLIAVISSVAWRSRASRLMSAE